MLASFGADLVLLCQSRLHDPSSRSAEAKRDLTIQSVPACYSIKSNGCVLDEEKLAPL